MEQKLLKSLAINTHIDQIPGGKRLNVIQWISYINYIKSREKRHTLRKPEICKKITKGKQFLYMLHPSQNCTRVSRTLTVSRVSA